VREDDEEIGVMGRIRRWGDREIGGIKKMMETLNDLFSNLPMES
jgi:hypothetical protein